GTTAAGARHPRREKEVGRRARPTRGTVGPAQAGRPLSRFNLQHPLEAATQFSGNSRHSGHGTPFALYAAALLTDRRKLMQTIDVRTISPHERHPTIFKLFDSLAEGDAFI